MKTVLEPFERALIEENLKYYKYESGGNRWSWRWIESKFSEIYAEETKGVERRVIKKLLDAKWLQAEREKEEAEKNLLPHQENE